MQFLKKITLLSLILFIQSSVGIFGSAIALDAKYSGLVQQGIFVKGIPLGGLNPAELSSKLESALSAPLENTFELEGAGKKYFINLSDIDGRYDYLSTAEEVLNYGKNEGNINQLVTLLRLRAAPVDLAAKVSFSVEKLAEKVRNLQRNWEARPKNAKVLMVNQKVVITPGESGYNLDFEKTLEQAGMALAEGNFHAVASVQILQPDISAADLNGINTLLAEYSTTFDEDAANRAHNIALASASIDGTLLKPGELFSLNKRLGPRISETGYLKAPVFIENQLALDFGGGICQVATTLYNAVLLSDLTVAERHPHPQPVNYISPGRDATIAGDSFDLKFVNNRETPVYISSQVESGTLTIRIFGAGDNNGRTVRILSENVVIDPDVVILQDETLKEGETRVMHPGKEGYEIRVYREIVVDGKVESKTLISTDYFSPLDKIILVGSKQNELKNK